MLGEAAWTKSMRAMTGAARSNAEFETREKQSIKVAQFELNHAAEIREVVGAQYVESERLPMFEHTQKLATERSYVRQALVTQIDDGLLVAWNAYFNYLSENGSLRADIRKRAFAETKDVTHQFGSCKSRNSRYQDILAFEALATTQLSKIGAEAICFALGGLLRPTMHWRCLRRH